MANETNIEMLSHEAQTVTENTYFFRDGGIRFTYKEWIDDKDRVIDSVLRNIDGHEIDDPVLQHRVWEVLDKYDASKTKAK